MYLVIDVSLRQQRQMIHTNGTYMLVVFALACFSGSSIFSVGLTLFSICTVTNGLQLRASLINKFPGGP